MPRKGRAWGNALGGWRKQSRKTNGQFGRGGGSAKKATKKSPASRKKAAASRKAHKATSKARSAPKKKRKDMTPEELRKDDLRKFKRNMKIVAAGAAAYGGYKLFREAQYRQLPNDFSTVLTDQDTGITYSVVQTRQRQSVKYVRGQGIMTNKPVSAMTVSAYGGASGAPLGYRTVSSTRKIAEFDNIYVAEAGRGKGLATNMTNIARAHVEPGKKIKVSSFRSDMGDRQARKMFSPDEIPKRDKYATADISEHMDANWATSARHAVLRQSMSHHGYNFQQRVIRNHYDASTRRRRQAAGVVI